MARQDEIERRCALTRELKPTAALIRFVVGPEGGLVPDTDARAGGRGVWISLGATHVAEAMRRRVFARSLKGPVAVPDDLVALTRLRLEQRLVAALQMARKAGQLLTGATKVKAALETGEAIALLTATDAAADGRGKLVGSLRGADFAAAEAGLSQGPRPHFDLLDSGQLGLALGIESVIHAAPTQGAAGEAVVKRAERLARYIAN